MLAVMGSASGPIVMLITSDLKKRLNSEFFTHLISQLTSSATAAPCAPWLREDGQAAMIHGKPSKTMDGVYDRLRLAMYQT